VFKHSLVVNRALVLNCMVECNLETKWTGV